jgi:hypothetical protein
MLHFMSPPYSDFSFRSSQEAMLDFEQNTCSGSCQGMVFQPLCPVDQVAIIGTRRMLDLHMSFDRSARTREAEIEQRDHVAVAPRKANDLGLGLLPCMDGADFKS